MRDGTIYVLLHHIEEIERNEAVKVPQRYDRRVWNPDVLAVDRRGPSGPTK
jgi:hypothetical protein